MPSSPQYIHYRTIKRCLFCAINSHGLTGTAYMDTFFSPADCGGRRIDRVACEGRTQVHRTFDRRQSSDISFVRTAVPLLPVDACLNQCTRRQLVRISEHAVGVIIYFQDPLAPDSESRVLAVVRRLGCPGLRTRGCGSRWLRDRRRGPCRL